MKILNSVIGRLDRLKVRLLGRRYFSMQGEDRILYQRFFKKYVKSEKKCTFLELGAHDGIHASNTKFYEDTLRWRGILIEARKDLFERCLHNRKNCYVYCAVVSDTSDNVVDFKSHGTRLSIGGVLSTMSPETEKLYHEGDITIEPRKTVSLSQIIEGVGFKKIELVSVDVEGHEYEVLRSIDFKNTEVVVILVEIQPSRYNPKESAIFKLLEGVGFDFKLRIGRDAVFVNRKYLHFWH